MKKSWLALLCIILLVPLSVNATEELSIRQQYDAYEERFMAIERYEDVESNGFRLMEGQLFQECFESFGTQTLTFFAAMDEKYNRLALFLMDEEGKILFKTNQLETNYQIHGEMTQITTEIAAVSFLDLNADGAKDILIITKCQNNLGKKDGKKYKVGEVLFQKDGSFYRDYRISDKINRFSMNKSAKCIVSFVRDGKSAEFLYTATTIKDLLENDFQIIEEQSYARNFEKLGRLQVIPGIYSMGDYDIFMIYLVNEMGNIVWSFQPMMDYDNLYSLRGVTCKDVDGDGMKDLVVLARYSYETPEGELIVESDYSIYYQRTGGFDEDIEFRKRFKSTEQHKMEDLVREIRSYWGWQTEEIPILEEGKK